MKRLELDIKSCEDCPNLWYSSGFGIRYCRKMLDCYSDCIDEAEITDYKTIHPDCPLPDAEVEE